MASEVSATELLQELVQAIHSLQGDVKKLNRNLTVLKDQQKDMAEVCQVWNNWMEASMAAPPKQTQQLDKEKDGRGDQMES